MSAQTQSELSKAEYELNRETERHNKIVKSNKIIRSGKDVENQLKQLWGDEYNNFSDYDVKKMHEGKRALGEFQPFSSYILTNRNANIKRLTDRVKMLTNKVEASKKVSETGQEERYTFDGGEILVNYPLDRLQVLFPGGRTDSEMYKKLRSYGFVYSPSNKAFQRKITPQAIRTAISLFQAKTVTSEAPAPTLELGEVKPVVEEVIETPAPEPKTKIEKEVYYRDWKGYMQNFNDSLVGKPAYITKEGRDYDGFAVFKNENNDKYYFLTYEEKQGDVTGLLYLDTNLIEQDSNGEPIHVKSYENPGYNIDKKMISRALSQLANSNIYDLEQNNSIIPFEDESPEVGLAHKNNKQEFEVVGYNSQFNVYLLRAPKVGYYTRTSNQLKFGFGEPTKKPAPFPKEKQSPEPKTEIQKEVEKKYPGMSDKIVFATMPKANEEPASKGYREYNDLSAKYQQNFNHPFVGKPVYFELENGDFPGTVLFKDEDKDMYYGLYRVVGVANTVRYEAKAMPEGVVMGVHNYIGGEEEKNKAESKKIKDLVSEYLNLYPINLKSLDSVIPFEDKSPLIGDTFNDNKYGQSIIVGWNNKFKIYVLHTITDEDGVGENWFTRPGYVITALSSRITEKTEPSVEAVAQVVTNVIPAYDTKQYKNQYELNKGIEKWLDENKDIDPNQVPSDIKTFIKKYSGYGGLSQYGPGGKGAFFEYYTPTEVIKKMWALAYKHGYNDLGSVLEPSIGTGEMLQFVKPGTTVTGYEINPYSARISKILYPFANIYHQEFEKVFIQNNWTVKNKIGHLPSFDLVIGNPPYGAFDVVASRYMTGMGELEFTKANNYVEYFLRRGIDLVNPGGLLIYIVGSSIKGGGTMFLDSKLTPVKEYLAKVCTLVDAYRLPDSIFERTEVTSDIIVLRKNG